MAITPQALADSFTAAGLDTPEAVTAALSTLVKQKELRAIELAIDALDKERVAVLAPIENKRIDLTNARNALIDQLEPKP